MFGKKNEKKRDDIPETITDDQMDSIRVRAAKKNPEMQSFTNADATRHRKIAKENSRKARWS